MPARGDGDDPARPVEIAGPERVVDRLVVIPPLLVPGRSTRVQPGDFCGMGCPQPGAQDLGEQRVIAVPAPLVVERDDQEVGALQLLESRLAVAPSGDRLAERSAQALEDRVRRRNTSDSRGNPARTSSTT